MDDTKTPQVDKETYAATQALIQRLAEQQEQLQNDIKTQREMLKGIFDNDEKLYKAERTAETATKELKERKTELNESSQAKTIKAKIGEINEELKIVIDSLNNHLISYFQLTGSKVVDTPDGKEREFEIKAKLKSKRSEE